MAIQQVSVFVQNKPGALSAICKLLAESGVDMRAMFISDTKEFSILRLIADDTEKAAESFAGSELYCFHQSCHWGRCTGCTGRNRWNVAGIV